ncbi:MAG: HK97-gp10 family putative phage morphogenesis protein [Cetobacterium sp.]
MDYVQVRVTNLNEVQGKIKGLSMKLKSEVEELITFYGLETQKLIRKKLTDNKSVKSGRLRRSININKIGRFECRVGTNVFYAPYVEYGTRRARAKPYIKPVFEDVEKRFTKDIKKILGDLI